MTYEVSSGTLRLYSLTYLHCQVAHGEVMKSIDRAISKVEEQISQTPHNAESTNQLQENLRYLICLFYLYVYQSLLLFSL